MSLFKIIDFDIIDSTSTYLKNNYKNLDNYTIVFASTQTDGHGRMKRKWYSSEDDAILFSILFKDKEIIERFSDLSLHSAVAIFRFLSNFTSNLSIKWPNDVYLNNKKVSGMLLEGIAINEVEAIIDGIGININQLNFDEEIKHKATSLALETNKKYNIEELKNLLLTEIEKMIYEIKRNDRSYLDVVRKNNFLKDKIIKASVDGTIKECRVIDINDDNSLKVLCDNEFKNLYVGEVLPIN